MRPIISADQIATLERQFLKPHRRVITLAVVGMFISSLLLLPIPLMQGEVIDSLSADAGAAAPWIAICLTGSIACYMARTLLSWKVASAMSRVSLEVVREVTDAMHRKLQRLPLPYYDRQETGQIMARITSDVGSLLIFLNSASLQLFSDLILAAGIVVVLFLLDWRLASISVAIMPLFGLNHRAFSRRIQERCARVRTQTAGLYALLSERISAIRLVRSSAEEATEIREFDRRTEEQRAAAWGSLSAAALEACFATLVGGFGSVAVLLSGVALIRSDLLTIGELLAFYALAVQLYAPITRLAHFHGILSATGIALERIAELLNEPELIVDRPGVLPLVAASEPLIFENVTFTYPGHTCSALKNINLRIEPGMTVGIVGPSGAGKSTLFALATRLYEANEGVIRFGETDIRDVRIADLRRTILLVPQNAVLFEGTLHSNLLYGCTDATESDVRKALQVAYLTGLVERLPRGLDTPVGERGLNFSGGQRQRIALARALIAAPAVLLMDDCASALDQATEAAIFREIKLAYPAQMRIIISHRLDVHHGADVIIELQEGQIKKNSLTVKSSDALSVGM